MLLWMGDAAESTSATYEIVVRGRLDELLVAAIGARHFEPCEGTTVLVVDVIDRAHLHGVLTQLHDNNVEVERVNPL
jgi:hypothetical protein